MYETLRLSVGRPSSGGGGGGDNRSGGGGGVPGRRSRPAAATAVHLPESRCRVRQADRLDVSYNGGRCADRRSPLLVDACSLKSTLPPCGKSHSSVRSLTPRRNISYRAYMYVLYDGLRVLLVSHHTAGRQAGGRAGGRVASPSPLPHPQSALSPAPLKST